MAATTAPSAGTSAPADERHRAPRRTFAPCRARSRGTRPAPGAESLAAWAPAAGAAPVGIFSGDGVAAGLGPVVGAGAAGPHHRGDRPGLRGATDDHPRRGHELRFHAALRSEEHTS